MREQEIRDVLGRVCRDLDLRAAARWSAVSAVLSASLVAGGGCGGTTTEPTPDAGEDAAEGGAQDASSEDSGPVFHYGSPFSDDGGPDAKLAPDADLDSGAIPPYMVQPIDGGPVLEYMAPLVDAGPEPVYMVQ